MPGPGAGRAGTGGAVRVAVLGGGGAAAALAVVVAAAAAAAAVQQRRRRGEPAAMPAVWRESSGRVFRSIIYR